jgi:hypothetical protein
VYYISPDGDNETAFSVYCDMDTDGGGWSLVYKRADNNTFGVTEALNPDDLAVPDGFGFAKLSDVHIQQLTTERWRVQPISPPSIGIDAQTSRYFDTSCLWSSDSTTSNGGQCVTSCDDYGMTSDCYTGDVYLDYGIRNYCCTTFYSNYRMIMYDSGAYFYIPGFGTFDVNNGTDIALIWVR